jgi:Flp pilus assembly protein TadD
MSRKLALLASVIAMPLLAAPAFAAPGQAPATQAASTQAAAQGNAQAAAATAAKPRPTPEKATPEQRAEAERLDPLARAAFWARETDVDPLDNDARLKLAKALRALGRFDEATADADQVLVMEPTNYEALLESARSRIAANQGFYAIDTAQRAEALQPRDWRPVSLLAVALEQSDRDSDALVAHQKALALAPNNPATLTNLGMYFATHGDPARAEPLLRQAAAAPGATAQERQNLALVLGLEGKLDEAERLERQDLPPDAVQNNLAYLRADNAPPHARTWDSLKSPSP